MDLRAQLEQRRKDTRFIIVVLGLLLVILTGIYYLIQSSNDLPGEVATSRTLLFALWYVDIVVGVAFLLVLGRVVLKLLAERSNYLGGGFRFKLVGLYIGLSLIPVLLLFAFATWLLQGSFDRLFSSDVRQALEQGSRVVDALHQRIERGVALDAARAADELQGFDVTDLAQRPRLASTMQQVLGNLGVDYLAVYDNDQFLHAVLSPQRGLDDFAEPPRAFFEQTRTEGRAVAVRELRGGRGRLVLAGAAVSGQPGRIAVVGSFLDPLVASQGDLFVQAWQGYSQLELRVSEIRTIYLLTMLMLTLSILLALVWVGSKLASRLSSPIQALAEGTRQLSRGDLDYRVEVSADDELGILVESFNRMGEELNRSRSLLEEANRELVATNREVAEERALVAAVLENLAAGVLSVDAEGRVLTCNDAALILLGQRREDLDGRTLSEVWTDPERSKLVELFERARTSGGLREEVRLALDGDWRTFEAKFTPLRGPDRRERGLVLVLEDQSELIHAQQLAAWNDAARRIAHEIKNPLTPIQLSADRLLRKHRARDPQLGEALEEAVTLIGREVASMRSMVDEFSRFARMPRPQPAPVQIDRLVEEVAQLYREVKPGVSVQATVDEDLPPVLLDADQMRGALINLLDNAIEATEAPGEVRIEARRRGDHLRIDVTDTGHGVSPEAREKLFLPHFSTRRRGSGLGLAIVHRIVTDHRGSIRVTDHRPRGTVFSLELPLA